MSRTIRTFTLTHAQQLHLTWSHCVTPAVRDQVDQYAHSLGGYVSHYSTNPQNGTITVEIRAA